MKDEHEYKESQLELELWKEARRKTYYKKKLDQENSYFLDGTITTVGKELVDEGNEVTKQVRWEWPEEEDEVKVQVCLCLVEESEERRV